MNTPRVVVSFRGCRTRADARGRFVAWLDQYYADYLRQFVTHRVLEDEDEDVECSVAQLRAELTRNRVALLARFDAIFDELETA